MRMAALLCAVAATVGSPALARDQKPAAGPRSALGPPGGRAPRKPPVRRPPPPVIQLRTADGAVTARQPADPAWKCEPRSRTAGEFEVSELECARDYPEGQLTLYAKDYKGQKEGIRTICARDWRSYYSVLISTAHRVRSGITTLRGRRVCEVNTEGAAPEGGRRIEIREWYVESRGHALIVGAAGPTARMAENRRAVEAWRDGIVFRAAR